MFVQLLCVRTLCITCGMVCPSVTALRKAELFVQRENVFVVVYGREAEWVNPVL